MNPLISKYKDKGILLPLTFAVFYGFFSIAFIISFLANPEGINLLAIIATLIVLLGSLIALVLGIYNYIYRKNVMKELSDGKKIELEIIGFIDSDKVVSGSSYIYRKYIIGCNNKNGKHYRSNGHHKNPDYRYIVGDKINMLYKGDDCFFMQTYEYIKNKK